MIDQYFTTVWSAEVSHSLPIRTATVVGTTVTVSSLKHHLITGDPIVVEAEAGYEQFEADTTVTVLDKNRFTYQLPSAPTIPFPVPKPGQGILIRGRIPKYSQIQSFPTKVRITVPTGSTVHVETFEDDVWVNQKILLPTDGITDVIFDSLWKEVRFKLNGGTVVPEAVAAHDTAPEQTPPNRVYHIPIVLGDSGSEGGGWGFTYGPTPPSTPEHGHRWLNSLDGVQYTWVMDGTLNSWRNISLAPIGTPGSYDVVTTNEYGLVISGIPSGDAGLDNNSYATFTNNGTVPILKCAVVRSTGSSTIELAQAVATKQNVIGIATEAIAVGASGKILVEGTFLANAVEWQQVTGMVGGLVTDGLPYFLDFNTAGMLEKSMDTSVAPPDAYLISIGYALTNQSFKLEIEPAIKL